MGKKTKRAAADREGFAADLAAIAGRLYGTLRAGLGEAETADALVTLAGLFGDDCRECFGEDGDEWWNEAEEPLDWEEALEAWCGEVAAALPGCFGDPSRAAAEAKRKRGAPLPRPA